MTAALLKSLITALFLSGLVCFLAYKIGFLTRSGLTAALFLGTVILGFGGWEAGIPLMVFFVSSSVLSKAREWSHPQVETAKSSHRDAAQVLANGGVAALIVAAQALCGIRLYPEFLGAVAAANADTWSTELGIRFGCNPRIFLSRRTAPAGTSGGVTTAGFIAALLGAILIAGVGYWSAETMPQIAVWAVTAAGFTGSLSDSFLGAFLQRRNCCTFCGKTTEEAVHCGRKSVYAGGIRWMNNDVVNFICTACGACVVGITTLGL